MILPSPRTRLGGAAILFLSAALPSCHSPGFRALSPGDQEFTFRATEVNVDGASLRKGEEHEEVLSSKVDGLWKICSIDFFTAAETPIVSYLGGSEPLGKNLLGTPTVFLSAGFPYRFPIEEAFRRSLESAALERLKEIPPEGLEIVIGGCFHPCSSIRVFSNRTLHESSQKQESFEITYRIQPSRAE